MNSIELRSRFPSDYKEFFRGCSVVTSAPMTFFFGGEHAVLDGSLSVCHNVPLKVFVGLEPSKGFEWGDWKYFDQRSDAFEGPTQWKGMVVERDAKRKETLEIILSYLSRQESLPARLSNWRTPIENANFKVCVLAELPACIGCNFSGAFSVAFAAALLLANGYPQDNYVAELQTQPLAREYLARVGWFFETNCHKGGASGYGTACPTSYIAEPIVYGRDRNAEAILPMRQYGLLWAIEWSCLSIDQFVSLTYPGKERFVDRWPFVYGVINTNRCKFTAKVNDDMRSRGRRDFDRADRLNRDLMRNLHPRDVGGLSIIGNNRTSDYLEFLRKAEHLPRTEERVYMNSLAILNSCLVSCLVDIYGTNEIGEDFFRIMNGIRGDFDKFGINPWEAHSLVGLLASEGLLPDKCALKFSGGGTGGTLVFACERDSWDAFMDCVNVATEQNPNLTIAWHSDEPGPNGDCAIYGVEVHTEWAS